MYFWRIEKLKEQLRKAPLSASDALPYLLVWVVFQAIFTDPYFYDPESTSNWTHLITLSSVLLGILGTIYCYRCNGGASGKDFLGRYFSITWVVFIRVIVWYLPFLIVAYIVVSELEVFAEPEKDSWFELAWLWLLEALAWWRSGLHMNSVANFGEPTGQSLGREIAPANTPQL